MQTPSALLALFLGESRSPGFLLQWTSNAGFGVFFDGSLNRRLNCWTDCWVASGLRLRGAHVTSLNQEAALMVQQDI